GAVVSSDHVGSAVAVDVGRRHRDGIVSGGELLLGGETGRGFGGRSVQQHRHGVGGVGDEQVGAAIAIYIRHSRGAGTGTSGEGLLGCKNGSDRDSWKITQT